MTERHINFFHANSKLLKLDMPAIAGEFIGGAKQGSYDIVPAIRQTTIAAAICLFTIRQTNIAAFFCLQQPPGLGRNKKGRSNAGKAHYGRLTVVISNEHGSPSGIIPDLRTGGPSPARGGPRTSLKRPKSRDNITMTGEVRWTQGPFAKRSCVKGSESGKPASPAAAAQRQPTMAGPLVRRARNRQA